jgi:hypothetical protein
MKKVDIDTKLLEELAKKIDKMHKSILDRVLLPPVEKKKQNSFRRFFGSGMSFADWDMEINSIVIPKMSAEEGIKPKSA